MTPPPSASLAPPASLAQRVRRQTTSLFLPPFAAFHLIRAFETAAASHKPGAEALINRHVHLALGELSEVHQNRPHGSTPTDFEINLASALSDVMGSPQLSRELHDNNVRGVVKLLKALPPVAPLTLARSIDWILDAGRNGQLSDAPERAIELTKAVTAESEHASYPLLLVIKLAEYGHFAHAEQIHRSFPEIAPWEDALRSVAYAGQGKWTERVLDSMEIIVDSLINGTAVGPFSGVPVHEIVHEHIISSIADGFTRHGQPEKARELLWITARVDPLSRVQLAKMSFQDGLVDGGFAFLRGIRAGDVPQKVMIDALDSLDGHMEPHARFRMQLALSAGEWDALPGRSHPAPKCPFPRRHPTRFEAAQRLNEANLARWSAARTPTAELPLALA